MEDRHCWVLNTPCTALPSTCSLATASAAPQAAMPSIHSTVHPWESTQPFMLWHD